MSKPYIDPDYLGIPKYSDLELPKFRSGHLKVFSGYKRGSKAWQKEVDKKYSEQSLFDNI